MFLCRVAKRGKSFAHMPILKYFNASKKLTKERMEILWDSVFCIIKSNNTKICVINSTSIVHPITHVLVKPDSN